MLTERQKRILWAVIDDYIVSAEPVGSRTVSQKEGLGVSSATIRHEMADLEDMGFLEQPHISAGRIPSQKGYRFYVDHLPLPYLWNKEDIRAIQDYSTFRLDDVEQTLQYISSLLAHLTNYMTFVVGCNPLEEQIKRLYTSGTARILEQPEFRDVERIKPLLDLIEEGHQVLMGLLKPKSAGVHVRIGCEHHVESVQHCSIVTSAYTIDGESSGAIGVLGPMRMDYRRVMGLIDFMVSDFSHRWRTLEK
jgi:transcriptional regulator of heat shock response